MDENILTEFKTEKKVDVSGFLAQIGHDLRVPMNTIIGSSEVILHENVSRKVRDSVNEIRRAAGMLTGLTDDIIDLVRINSGDLPIGAEEYFGLDLSLDIRKLIENRSEESGIECDIDIDGNIPYRLVGDVRRLEQMLEKLVTNAFEFTKEGRVGFTFNCLPNADNGVYLRISISDSSAGVLNESIVKVLGGKTWDESAVDGVQEGTATRVFLVRILAELMGGKLTARSVRDTGNTFTLLIPQRTVGICTISDVAERDADVGKAGFTAESARVLIVDTDAERGRGLCRKLRRYGISADLTTGGAAAMQLVGGISYDLIFADMNITAPDIAEFTSMVRAAVAGKGAGAGEHVLPVVGLTEAVDTDITQLLTGTGLCDCIPADQGEQELERVLRARLPIGRITEREQAEPVGVGIEALDRLGLNTRIALENFGGDEEEYRKVLRTMCRTSDTKGKMLIYYLEQHDYKNYLIAMHGILGEAKVIGAEWIENKTQELERAAKQGMRDIVERETGILAENYDKLLSAIRSAIDSEENDVIKGAIDRDDLVALLSQLSTYLEEYQIDEVEELFYSLAQFSYPDPNVMMKLHEAEEKMMTYDYNAVLDCVEEILSMVKDK